MKIKIISDYRKLMAMGIPQEHAVDLAASTIVDASLCSNLGESLRKVSVCSSLSSTYWIINEKLGKVTLWTEVK